MRQLGTSHVRLGSPCRYQVAACGIVIVSLFVTSHALAQGVPSPTASETLAEFDRQWDDTRWAPPTGRLSMYLRPENDSGWSQRMHAFATLALSGKQSSPSLIAALKSESMPVRALAAQTLGFTGDESAKTALASAVEHDPEGIVRLYAADSLGMLGGKDHLELLRRLETSEKNADVKRHLGYAIDRDGAASDGRARQQLKQWSENSRPEVRVGSIAPDFELSALSGDLVRLSQYRDKNAVVLVFIYGDT